MRRVGSTRRRSAKDVGGGRMNRHSLLQKGPAASSQRALEGTNRLQEAPTQNVPRPNTVARTRSRTRGG